MNTVTAFQPEQEIPDRFASLVERIRAREAEAETELYEILNRGIRYVIMRQIRPTADVEDRVHEVFMVALQAIREDRLRDPARLMGFVRSVVANQVATYLTRTLKKREREVDAETPGFELRDPGRNPEQMVIDGERIECARKMLDALCERDRCILLRFYVHGQSREQIMADMNLTDTQFRLFKWRARARYDELVRRRLNRRLPDTVGACGAMLGYASV